jgi:hypothetical protein
MRLVNMVVVATLSVVVIAEGAYLIRTRRHVAELTERLEQVAADRDEGPRRGTATPGGSGPGSWGGGDSPRAALRPPPPRLIAPAPTSAPPAPALSPAPAGGGPLALPPALDNPEAREQLRQFVRAQMEAERQETRERQDQRRDEREQAARDRMTKELGLSPAESEKFNQIFADARGARQDLRARVESGQLQPESIGQEMAAMRARNDEQLRGLLGDERMKKLEQLRPRGEGPGPWGGGWRGGGGGQGRPQGPRGPGGAP